MKDAGFTESGDAVVKTDTTATAAFSSDKYDVVVAVVKADEKTGFVANYTVAKHKADSSSN